MQYISTRGRSAPLPFLDVLTTGVATDGGLYVPSHIPQFSAETIRSWKSLSYPALAYEILSPFIGHEIAEIDLRRILEQSYSNFRHKDIAPLVKLESGHHILELFHGPTLAFKDFALQFLGLLLDHVLTKRDQRVVVIGATSGDTGSAAITGLSTCSRATIFMLHPHGRISEVQRRQMTTVINNRVHNIALEGTFDDCQNIVKHLFRDPDLLSAHSLVAVNSINWTRLMAQIVYYFYAALRLNGATKPISFSVPTGNFGDIYAGYIAAKMGLPIEKLIVATNSNDILHRFFQENAYSKRDVVKTYSPSMDIQISSNFERLLFDLCMNNGEPVYQLMQRFGQGRPISVPPALLSRIREQFDSCRVDNDTTLSVIRDVFEKRNMIVDPHTATGIHAARSCAHSGDIITLATAHPAKFGDVIQQAIGKNPALPEHMRDLFQREERMNILPNSAQSVKQFIASHA